MASISLNNKIIEIICIVTYEVLMRSSSTEALPSIPLISYFYYYTTDNSYKKLILNFDATSSSNLISNRYAI